MYAATVYCTLQSDKTLAYLCESLFPIFFNNFQKALDPHVTLGYMLDIVTNIEKKSLLYSSFREISSVIFRKLQ